MALFVKEITSIGAVDTGDNPEADIVFWKRNANALSVESTQREDMSLDIDALPEELQTEITDLVKSHEDATARIAELEAAVVELTPEEDPVEEASDEVQALIAKQRDELAAVAEELAVEKAARRDVEFTAKVEADNLVPLLGNAEEMGPMLRRLATADEEAFDTVYGSIVAAAQRVELAKAFEELGVNNGEASPQDRATAWVAKRKEDGSEQSAAELEADYWRTHPDERAALREMG